MVSKIFVSELVEDTHIHTTFLAAEKSVRQTKYGDPYVCVTLADRSGTIEARAWENARALAERFERRDFVIVSGAVTSYQSSLQIKILDMDRVRPTEVEPGDYLPTSRWPAEALFAQLKDLVLDELQSPAMRQFLKTLLADSELMERFKLSPAAVANHHGYLSGLIEHVLSMARVAVRLCDHYMAYYPGLINKDLVIAGCILHDIGKCYELSHDRSFEYTTEGRLVGHIVRGVEIVDELAGRMRPAPPEEMILQLKHLILSHHGRLDYGSPVRPQTPEAILLHEIDMIDSRMNMIARLMEQHQDRSDAWTDYHRALEGRLYLGDPEASWHQEPFVPPESLSGPGVRSLDDHSSRLRGPVPPPSEQSREGRSRNDDMTLNLFGESFKET